MIGSYFSFAFAIKRRRRQRSEVATISSFYREAPGVLFNPGEMQPNSPFPAVLASKFESTNDTVGAKIEFIRFVGQ